MSVKTFIIVVLCTCWLLLTASLILLAKQAGEIRGPSSAGRSAEGYVRNSRFIVGKYGSWNGYREKSYWLVTVIDLSSHSRRERTILSLDTQKAKLGRLSFADEHTATIEIISESSDTTTKELNLSSLWNFGFSLNVAYCPVTHSFTQGKTLNAYLRLDDNGSPDCLELRQVDAERSSEPKVLFRAFGAVTVTMKLEMRGVRFSLFSDSVSSQADTSFVLDVLRANPYFECRLRRKS